MKKLLVVLAVLAFTVGVGAIKAEAATTDSIAVTVTMQNLAISVTPDTWDMGVVAPSSTNTLACVASNDGNVASNMDIAVSNSTAWTAGAIAGANVFAMDFQLSGGPPTWTNITNAGVDLVNGLGGTQNFTLRFTAPSSSAVYTPQSISVTVSATLA